MTCVFIDGRTDVPPGQGGSKAAHLARLVRTGLRVPPAFVLRTDVAREVQTATGHLPDHVRSALRDGIAYLERVSGRTFGGYRRPLLVSVRSSPPISMPGMLETVLNIGLTSSAIRGLLKSTGNPYLTWDTARRFAESFAHIVLGCPSAPFHDAVAQATGAAGARSISELDPLTLRDLAVDARALVHTETGTELPDDPYVQLEKAVESVFRSSGSARAEEYRRLNGLDPHAGTAVIVQMMVMGNDRGASGSGVGFTRNPATGEDELYVDYLPNAQGEDVVSGRRAVATAAAELPAAVDAELRRAKAVLEREFGDMQDFEFTVEDGALYFLQTRDGKRTPWAAAQIAVSLVRQGLITSDEALQRLEAYDVDTLERRRLAPSPTTPLVATGVPASIGVATGAAVFDAERAVALAATRPVIFVSEDFTTDDVAALAASNGILTMHGARTSHAAVVARQLGRVCVVSCPDLRIDPAMKHAAIGNHVIHEGDILTLDGESGHVFAGDVATISERPEAALTEIREWRRTRVAAHP